MEKYARVVTETRQEYEEQRLEQRKIMLRR